MTIYEIDVLDPEREQFSRWAQCDQCHRPDVAIDQINGMCYQCWREVTAP